MRLALLALLLLLTALPRFNRQDIGPVSQLTAGSGDLDATEYIRLVTLFRGDLDAKVDRPYSYRLLPSLLAAPLPLPPATALNTINLLALLATLLLIDKILQNRGHPPAQRAFGGALHALSFPVFYYGAIGLVDPVLLAFAAWAALHLDARRPLQAGIILLVATTATEKSIFLLPAIWALLTLRMGMSWPAATAWAAALAAAWLLILITLQAYSPVIRTNPYIWEPLWTCFLNNATRWRCWASAALSLGLPGLLALRAAARWLQPANRPALQENFTQNAPALAATAGAAALWLFALASTYADGRALWLATPFLIPLALQQTPTRPMRPIRPM